MNLTQFKAWTHWLAGILLTGFGLYASNTAVHQAVNNAIAQNKKLAGFVAVMVPIITAYLNSQKDTK